MWSPGPAKPCWPLGAIAKLKERFAWGPELKIKIIVPKIFLTHQWYQALVTDLRVPRNEIGIYSGERRDLNSRPIMIYVVNSARNSFAHHFLEDYRQGFAQLVIADECHHYGSLENSRIFSYLAQISRTQLESRYFSLGLSATPQCETFQEKLVPALGQQIFQYGFAEALNDNIISPFSVFNLRLQFNRTEAQQYQEFSDRISRSLNIFLRLRPSLSRLPRDRFFAVLEQLTREEDDSEEASLARTIQHYSILRRDLVHRAEARVSCLRYLITLIPHSSRILIFSERIELAEEIFRQIEALFPGQVGRYHSHLDKQTRKRTLERYNNSELRILVSCRALDEGLDVPATDVGIIAASSSSSRQRIQRLGRILRRSGSPQTAYLYYLYVGASNEEEELLAEISDKLIGLIPVVDLDYDQETQSFSEEAYDRLSDHVLDYAQQRNWGQPIIKELERNLTLGKIRCDWWIPEKTCLEKIQRATARSERNYWITMRLLIRASLNRL
jgi:superfamily II DNA or RNA helicase